MKFNFAILGPYSKKAENIALYMLIVRSVGTSECQVMSNQLLEAFHRLHTCYTDNISDKHQCTDDFYYLTDQ